MSDEPRAVGGEHPPRLEAGDEAALDAIWERIGRERGLHAGRAPARGSPLSEAAALTPGALAATTLAADLAVRDYAAQDKVLRAEQDIPPFERAVLLVTLGRLAGRPELLEEARALLSAIAEDVRPVLLAALAGYRPTNRPDAGGAAASATEEPE